MVKASTFAEILNKEIPKSFSNHPGAADTYNMTRGQFNISTNNNKLIIDCALEGSGKKKLWFISIPIDLKGNIRITLSNIGLDPNWNLVVKPTITIHHEEVKFYKINIGLFWKWIKNYILKKIEPKINRAIRDIDLKSEIEKVWELCHQVFQLRDNGWFVIKPTGLCITNVRANANDIQLSVGVFFESSLHVGDEAPVSPEIAPLPQQRSDVDLDGGFELSVPVIAEFTSLSGLLNDFYSPIKVSIGKELLGKELLKLELSSFKLSGTLGKKLLLSAEFSTSRWWTPHGSVHLWAKPQLTESGDSLSFKDLNFTVKSKNVLAKVLSTVIRHQYKEGLNVDLTRELEDAFFAKLDSLFELGFSVDLTRELEDAEQKVRLIIDGINEAPFGESIGVSIKLSGDNRLVKIRELVIGKEELAAIAKATGQINVEIINVD